MFPFCTSLETSENHRFPDVFIEINEGHRKGPLIWNELKKITSISLTSIIWPRCLLHYARNCFEYVMREVNYYLKYVLNLKFFLFSEIFQHLKKGQFLVRRSKLYRNHAFIWCPWPLVIIHLVCMQSVKFFEKFAYVRNERSFLNLLWTFSFAPKVARMTVLLIKYTYIYIAP